MLVAEETTSNRICLLLKAKKIIDMFQVTQPYLENISDPTGFFWLSDLLSILSRQKNVFSL